MTTRALIQTAFSAHRGGDRKTSVKLLRELENANHRHAWFVAALIRLEKVRTQADQVRVFESLKKSAELGEAYGRFYTGLCYQAGFGVRKNRSTAQRRFRESAKLGCTNAMFALGKMYRRGEGVEPDIQQSLEFYERAANVGAFASGNRADATVESITQYIRESEAQTRLLAQEALCEIYLDGEWGGDADVESARYWLGVAAGNGSDYAKQQIKTLPARVASPPDKVVIKVPAAPRNVNGVDQTEAYNRAQKYRSAQPPNNKFAVRYLSIAQLLGHRDARPELKTIQAEVGDATYRSFFFGWSDVEKVGD